MVAILRFVEGERGGGEGTVSFPLPFRCFLPTARLSTAFYWLYLSESPAVRVYLPGRTTSRDPAAKK